MHFVRIWRVSDQALVAGPFSWNFQSGLQGWKIFMLPSPLAISANTDYIVAISNSSDLYYGERFNAFNAPIVNGDLHTYKGSGVWTDKLGTMPASSWQNTSYFRDVLFDPQQ